jgi:hypoxanthine phosphoribosyltransferase
VKERPEVLFTEAQIQERVRSVGAEVTRLFAGKEITVVGLMKSCLLFMADLVRTVPLDMSCHFLRATSLRDGGHGSLRTDIVYSAEVPYQGREILLLADIVDTGITLNFLLDHIRDKGPASLRVASIIDKPGERKVDAKPDWALFTLQDPIGRFLVGYGLDYQERYRGLPYIGTIPLPAPAAEERTIALAPGN